MRKDGICNLVGICKLQVVFGNEYFELNIFGHNSACMHLHVCLYACVHVCVASGMCYV